MKTWQSIRQDKRSLERGFPVGTQEVVLDALIELDKRLKQLEKKD